MSSDQTEQVLTNLLTKSRDEDYIPFREVLSTLGPHWSDTIRFLSRSERSRKPPTRFTFEQKPSKSSDSSESSVDNDMMDIEEDTTIYNAIEISDDSEDHKSNHHEETEAIVANLVEENRQDQFIVRFANDWNAEGKPISWMTMKRR